MASKNRVTLTGTIATDPTTTKTAIGGMLVLSFMLLVVEDLHGRKRTSHYPVVAFGRRAEALTKVLRDGQHVYVEGSLRVTPDENREGRTIARAEVVADEVLLVMPGDAALEGT